MPKLKAPILSLMATGRLGKLLALARRGGRNIIERRPIPTDAKSPNQLFFRHMFTKCIDLWHLLSEAEKQEWESSARPRHMTGYAWYMSQCLRPNPGIYLPLQGGAMQGIIDMEGFQIEDLPDPTNPQDADTEAARDAAIAAALADCIDSHIHGWDGSNWQKLLAESATQHNLRVRLYDGPNGIDSQLVDTNMGTERGLAVAASLYGHVGANDIRLIKADNTAADSKGASAIALEIISFIHGFNGSTWDRLRTYGTGILKVGRAKIGLLTLRRVGAGQVKASAGNLYWMNLNPSAGLSAFEITDDLNGLGAIVLDHFDTTRDGHILTFDPPMEFTTGIHLKTLTNMTSITFGYK